VAIIATPKLAKISFLILYKIISIYINALWLKRQNQNSIKETAAKALL
jgi:hypothetical protein